MSGRRILVVAVCAVGCLAGPRHRTTASTTTVAATTTNASPSSCPNDLGSVAMTVEPAPGDPAPDPSTDVPEPIASSTPSSSPTSASTISFPGGNAPAFTYAALDAASCEAQLKKRGISYTNVGSANGVDRPIRLGGPLRGVTYHGIGNAKTLSTSIYEIIDCRLALALDDFAVILAKYDVVEALHMSIYRPAPKGTKPGERSRHEAALAIDLGTLVRKDGSYLSVLEDWHGHIGDKTCVPGAQGPTVQTKKSRELRSILCEASNAKLFNVILTPNYNKPHENHFHLEVTRGVKWTIVH